MNNSFFSWFLLINSIIAVIVIILERRKPEKTIAWLLLFLLLPAVGLIFYLFLGRNWKKHKLNENFSPYVKELINRVINRIDNPDYIPLVELLANNSDSPLFVDNDICIFNSGEGKFKALKEEMLKAKHHIHLEYYIVRSDKIGNEIKDILVKKASEGVEVRFIMDRVGSIGVKKKYIRELKKAGVDVVQYSYFLAPLLKFINTKINYRNHRKIAVIDGKVGFTGGMNIGDDYLGHGKLGEWKDTHIMVKGDFVFGLQAVFIDDFSAIKKLQGEYYFASENFEKYFPIQKKSKNKIMQLVKSGPDSEYAAIMQGVFKLITIAKDHIYIATPYFVPPESIMEAIKMAALGGIKVKILFPGRYDHFTVYYASKSYLAELLKCGVEVYLYPNKAFLHSKTITVDGKISTIGTANMDFRSYELNYEVNAVIYDDETSQELEEDFEKSIQISELMTIEKYQNESFAAKTVEAVARVFSSLL